MEKHHDAGLIQLHPLQGVEQGRLLLKVEGANISIPRSIKLFADQNDFKPKDEFHVTVLGKRTQEMLAAEGVADIATSLLEDVTCWSFATKDEFLLLRNVEIDDNGGQIIEESIIQPVAILELDDLYDDIRQATGLDVPTPPAHITLFTKNADRGIGIYSGAQLAKYTIKRLY